MEFGFRNLDVWKKAVKFTEEIICLTENLNTKSKHYRLVENLESAAASVATNIAEGKGRYSKKEFVQFLYIARGSMYETITILEIFYNRKWVNGSDYVKLIIDAEEIIKMIMGLINSIRQ